MTEAAPPPPPQAETAKISPDDLAQMIAATAIPTPVPEPAPRSGAMRSKLLVAVVIGAIGVGASIMSCVGQSFSLRQARAMEGIQQELKEIRASCIAGPREVAPR